jgi:cell division septation protein DedD
MPKKSSSVLDKYPERDLSHLSGEAPPPHTQEEYSAMAAERVNDGPPDDAADAAVQDEAAATSTDPAGGTPKNTASSSSKWPLLALLGVVLFLIAIAFIWHVNPWPSLKDALTGLFSSKERIELVATDTGPTSTGDIQQEGNAAMRSWDYFLQVSSWKDLSKADLDAERFRAQDFDVIVESEFIPKKGGTYYRVRLGPYATAQEAQDILTTHAALLPSGAFLDSTRLVADEAIKAVPPPSGKPRRVNNASREPARLGSDILSQPMNGWAVKVSSLKNEDIARNEARKLLEQGYPSFITRKHIASTVWYRVLVGPFSDKHDADRYMQLLNVTYGNEAYTVDLASY